MVIIVCGCMIMRVRCGCGVAPTATRTPNGIPIPALLRTNATRTHAQTPQTPQTPQTHTQNAHQRTHTWVTYPRSSRFFASPCWGSWCTNSLMSLLTLKIAWGVQRVEWKHSISGGKAAFAWLCLSVGRYFFLIFSDSDLWYNLRLSTLTFANEVEHNKMCFLCTL